MFRTQGIANLTLLPSHPAYGPHLPATQFRKFLTPEGATGDPIKAAKVIYELSHIPSPPFRVPLGKEAIEGYAAKLKKLNEEFDDRVKAWSSDISIE